MQIAEKSLGQLLAELEMMSHVGAVNPNASSRDAGEDIGGKRPPGGVDRREDRHRDPVQANDEPERLLRSASHFREQLARGRREGLVRVEVEASLVAWRRQPAAKNPVPGDPGWGRWVADSPLSDVELARMFGKSRQAFHQLRAKYRVAA